MPGKTLTRGRSGVRMPPEVKTAYGEIQGGLKSLGKAITEIQQGLRKAERKIEADARARIRALRHEAKVQLATLRAREREASQGLRELQGAAEGSWRDVKQTADGLVPFRRTPELSRCAAIPVSVFVVDGTHHVDG